MTQRHTIAERCNASTRIDPRLNGWCARRSPRWTMLNDFIDHGQRHLTPSAVRVWLVLFRETKPDGLARVTVEQIAASAGIRTRAVANGLRDLRANRFAVRVSRGSRNKGPSIHRLLPISTCTTVRTKGPNAPISTCTRVRTASCTTVHTPHKGQAHRSPLGASAVAGSGTENGQTLRENRSNVQVRTLPTNGNGHAEPVTAVSGIHARSTEPTPTPAPAAP